MDIAVKIGTLKLKNPVMVASGTFGYAQKYYDTKEIKKLGAIVPKTVTLKPREGNPPPRIAETASGMLNAIGIENPGADAFIAEKLPALARIGVPLIISILGHTEEEFDLLADQFQRTKQIHALELNLSCPNIQSKVLVAQDPGLTYRIVRRVKKRSRVPVIAKLAPNVTDIKPIARAAERGGADAVSLINTLTGMAVDIKKRRPLLGNRTGGLSGPAIKPVALAMVHEASRAVDIPVIGMGGIMNASDALEFMIAGATAVAVGTASFINPRAPLEIVEGIKAYMKENGMKKINDIVGSLKTE